MEAWEGTGGSDAAGCFWVGVAGTKTWVDPIGIRGEEVNLGWVCLTNAVGGRLILVDWFATRLGFGGACGSGCRAGGVAMVPEAFGRSVVGTSQALARRVGR